MLELVTLTDISGTATQQRAEVWRKVNRNEETVDLVRKRNVFIVT